MRADSAEVGAGSQVFYVVLACVAVTAMWWGMWAYVRPAVMTQHGRATRMERHQRVRRVAFALWWIVIPAVFTLSVISRIVTGETPQASGDGIWPQGLYAWLLWVPWCTSAVLLVAALILRTVDRHTMRAQHRGLGLPTPRPPLWPWAAVGTWVMTVVVFFTAGSVVFWRAVIAEIEQWATGLDARAQAAAVTKLTVEARMQSLLIAYGWTLLGVLILTVVIAVCVYRRQVRRRERYDRQIAASVSDAAALVL